MDIFLRSESTQVSWMENYIICEIARQTHLKLIQTASSCCSQPSDSNHGLSQWFFSAHTPLNNGPKSLIFSFGYAGDNSRHKKVGSMWLVYLPTLKVFIFVLMLVKPWIRIGISSRSHCSKLAVWKSKKSWSNPNPLWYLSLRKIHPCFFWNSYKQNKSDSKFDSKKCSMVVWKTTETKYRLICDVFTLSPSHLQITNKSRWTCAASLYIVILYQP